MTFRERRADPRAVAYKRKVVASLDRFEAEGVMTPAEADSIRNADPVSDLGLILLLLKRGQRRLNLNIRV